MSKWIDISEILAGASVDTAFKVVSSKSALIDFKAAPANGLTYAYSINPDSLDMPTAFSWQNAVIALRYHDGVPYAAQLYFARDRDMHFRSNQEEPWRVVVDSTNINTYIKQYLEEIGYKPT